MNKKKVIKIVTATAIAASAFTAVAPAQSEAATSLHIQIKAAKAEMIKPYNAYVKSTKLASVNTIKVHIKAAKKAQKDINAKINKAKLSKSEKKKKLAEIKAYSKYIARAEDYVKAYQEAKVAQTTLNALAAELEKSIATNDTAAILDLYAKLQEALKEAEIEIKVNVYGSKIRILLTDKFTKPTDTLLEKKLEKTINAHKKNYQKINKAEAAKVNAYVKLANGDLSTQALIDAAEKAGEAIDLKKLKVADQSNLRKKLVAADNKVKAAEDALKNPSVVAVNGVNAKKLVVTFNVAVDSTDASDKAKYTVAGETITNAEVSENGKSVTLTTEDELNVTNAVVTVSGIKTKQDTSVSTAQYTTSLTFADKKPVSVQDVKVTGDTAVITFNEPVQAVGTVSLNGIALPSSGYSVADNELTITSLPTTKKYKLEVIGATDFANNIAKSIKIK